MLDRLPAAAILNIELKDFRPEDHGPEQAVIGLLAQREAKGRVLISSLNPMALAAVAVAVAVATTGGGLGTVTVPTCGEDDQILRQQ